jgi:hypothetical protein
VGLVAIDEIFKTASGDRCTRFATQIRLKSTPNTLPMKLSSFGKDVLLDRLVIGIDYGKTFTGIAFASPSH